MASVWKLTVRVLAFFIKNIFVCYWGEKRKRKRKKKERKKRKVDKIKYRNDNSKNKTKQKQKTVMQLSSNKAVLESGKNINVSVYVLI